MWFAKLFGGRNADSDEPARFPSAPVSRPAQPAPESKPVAKAKPGKVTGKGFDPYNSGAFQRKNAWERISRR